MWPFPPPSGKASGAAAPRLTRATADDLRDIKLAELESRILGLECAVIEVCKAIQLHTENTNTNFMTMEKSFMTLVNYVLKPRAHIMGDQREEKN